MTNVRILVAAAISTLLATATASQQDPIPATSARIETLSAASFEPIPEAFCVAQVGATTTIYTVVSDTNGRAPLLGLTPALNTPSTPPDPETSAEHPVAITVEAAAIGYIPYKRVIDVAANSAVVAVLMTPERTGFMSPVITATNGGKFMLQGLGTLDVPANTLSQDAALRINVIPYCSMSHGIIEDVTYQVYAQACDAQGQELPGVLPASPSGITLTVELSSDMPSDGMEEKWITHALGTDFSQAIENVFAGNGKSVQPVPIPLLEGHNAVSHTYAVPDAQCNTLWSRWRIEKNLLWTRKEVLDMVNFKCGHYMAGKTIGRGRVVTHTNSVSISSTATSSIGIERETAIAKVTAEASISVTGTVESEILTSTTFESVTTVNATQPVSGVPGNQPAGWGCVSGKVEFGYLTSHYQIWAWRRKVCINGYVDQKKNLGTMDLTGPFDQWFSDVTWDPTCPGCAGSGDVPDDMRTY